MKIMLDKRLFLVYNGDIMKLANEPNSDKESKCFRMFFLVWCFVSLLAFLFRRLLSV